MRNVSRVRILRLAVSNCFMRDVFNGGSLHRVQDLFSMPAQLTNLLSVCLDSPLISVTPMNLAGVSLNSARPAASSLSLQQTSPAPSHCAPFTLV